MFSKSSPIFCGLAHSSLSLSSTGRVRPCCAIDSKTFGVVKTPKLSENNLNEVANSYEMNKLRQELKNGQWPEACRECQKKELEGGGSLRKSWNSHFQDPQKILLNINDDGSLKKLEELTYLDLTFGNKCNLRCITCNPTCSSAWIKESHEKGEYLDVTSQSPFDWYSAAVLDQLVNSLPNLKTLNFVGGEPLINKEHRFLLERLIEKKISSEIHLSYVTNLTILDDELVGLWRNFKSVALAVSVDGVDKINDYIRYPSNWSAFQANVEKLKKYTQSTNIYISWCLTISVFNILSLNELFKWMYYEYLDCPGEFNKRPGIFTPMPYMQRVFNPATMNISILPPELKSRAYEELQALEKTLKAFELPRWETISQVDVLKDWLQEAPANQNECWNTLLKDLVWTDQYRKLEVKNYIPWTKEYLS